MKKCSKCKEEKSFNCFSKDNHKKDRLKSHCKDCVKKHRNENKEYFKRYNRKNKEKIKDQQKQYREKNKEKISKWLKEYYNANKERLSEQKRQYRLKNKEKRNQYERQKNIEDPFYKFKNSVKKLISHTFKNNKLNKPSKTEEILGCTIHEFRCYIESKFEKGMTFKNHTTNGWHLDHIIPISSAKNEDDVVRLNHYTNFQPLWAEDNLKKSNKII